MWLQSTWLWIFLIALNIFLLLVLRYNNSFFACCLLSAERQLESVVVFSFLTPLLVGKPMVWETFIHVCFVDGGVSRGRAFKHFLSGW